VDENGNDVPRGQVGELLVKGQGIFKGYYKKPEENAKAFLGEYSAPATYSGRMQTATITL